MSNSRPIGSGRNRRDSVLDLGGPNSINNFVGSFKRSASFGQFNDYHPSDLDDEIHSPVFDDTSEHHYPVFDETSSLIDTATNSVPVAKLDGSTVYQTIFNAINVLVGMGILSLPLGFRLAGWVPGLLCLALAPLCTRYTAILLGRILDRHPQLKSYSDIGQYCLSKSFYSLLVFTFVIDLYGAALTLVLLFADSFSSITDIPAADYKIYVCTTLFFLSFLPLSILSYFSMVGIVSVSCIIGSLCVGGFMKAEAPGSILDSMPTAMWPKSPTAFFIAVGLFMAPWGGHVVFPELMRDMRHPHRYKEAVTASYVFAYSIDTFTASIGYLMFGYLTLPEVTNNILLTPAFPNWIKSVITICMGILPIAKLPLFVLPVIRFAEGLVPRTSLSYVLVRAGVAALLCMCSIYIVDFGRVTSVLGSLICIGTCITAPLVFYLLIMRNELSKMQKYLIVASIIGSVILSIVGTLAVFLGDTQ